MRVISVGGYTKTGKTSTTTLIISELKKRGYTVSSIKDIHFEAFTMEREGSDSWQHRDAGAEAVIARGLKETFYIRPKKMPLSDMLAMFDTDWVVIEGMKREPLPKIIAAESIEQLEELVDKNTFCITGKISKELKEFKGVPVLDNFEQADEIMKLVEEKVFEVLPLADEECCTECGFSCFDMVGEILAGRMKREDCKTDHKQDIKLYVAGKEITIVPFVQRILKTMVTGFVSNLHGYKEGEIEIKIK
ncbi:MAG: molybdopterin-guanine dinucleotide biosynthesis protein B [Candidatus Cloacimonas sp.]|nr:molybdopterin-guanine dinucleotide biosynthesis protein B [Candidatus Cloacimonadota bacterium]